MQSAKRPASQTGRENLGTQGAMRIASQAAHARRVSRFSYKSTTIIKVPDYQNMPKLIRAPDSRAYQTQNTLKKKQFNTVVILLV